MEKYKKKTNNNNNNKKQTKKLPVIIHDGQDGNFLVAQARYPFASFAKWEYVTRSTHAVCKYKSCSLTTKKLKKMNLQIMQVKIASSVYVRWKPFNFVVGEGPAQINGFNMYFRQEQFN